MKAKTNAGYRSFGIDLPFYLNVKDEDERHRIYHNFLVKYEAMTEFGDFDNEMYWFGFQNIEEMSMRMPGGIKEEWKSETVF